MFTPSIYDEDHDWELEGSVLVPFRPNHGSNQIMSVSELSKGQRLRMHSPDADSPHEVITTTDPYQEEKWQIGLKFLEIKNFEEEGYLADNGVVAYSNGFWNPTNWLEKIE